MNSYLTPSQKLDVQGVLEPNSQPICIDLMLRTCVKFSEEHLFCDFQSQKKGQFPGILLDLC